MQPLTRTLEAARPLLQGAAIVAGLLTVWSFAADIVPQLRQLWSPRVPTQTCALVAAALALVGGGR